MSLILSIETSTAICSVAIHKQGILIAQKSIDIPGAHGEKLMGLIELLLDENEIEASEIHAVAVSEGPGSYTGLRIGVSTAKGLALGWQVPLISVSTLKALALGAKKQTTCPGYIISLLDARRMEVFKEVYDFNLRTIEPLASEIVEENSYAELLEGRKVYFVGDAVKKVSSVLGNSNAVFLDVPISAEFIGELAFKKFEVSDFADLAYFVPNYLKEFKALHSKKNPLLL
jgi:tRNA threonylcarbamoyladenosine biosynthesis protein TsaB